jgi:hypothetical protein
MWFQFHARGLQILVEFRLRIKQWAIFRRLRGDYLITCRFHVDVPDYWKEGENRLLVGVEKEVGNQWR